MTESNPGFISPGPSRPPGKFPVWAIVLIVLVVLCSCCFGFIGLVFAFFDPISQEFGLSSLQIQLSII